MDFMFGLVQRGRRTKHPQACQVSDGPESVGDIAENYYIQLWSHMWLLIVTSSIHIFDVTLVGVRKRGEVERATRALPSVKLRALAPLRAYSDPIHHSAGGTRCLVGICS